MTDDSFGPDGLVKDGPLKNLLEKIAHAFHDWVDTILYARKALEARERESV